MPAMFLGTLLGAVLLEAGLSLILGVALALFGAGPVVLWRLSVPGAGWATAHQRFSGRMSPVRGAC
ncbi:hypothetical protein [Streptomyces sp. NPDC058157]|uniref:hypothetical protein n=1 Tax=Streptomyces sp. NPDC058157 TaxID=3346360 RepID=UPI0036EAFD62